MEENEVVTPESAEEQSTTTDPEDDAATNAEESTEKNGVEGDSESEKVETENTDAATSDTSDSTDATDIMFIDPSPVTTYTGDMYEIDLVHTITLGDFVVGTLLCILIVTQLLGRLLGGR